MYSNLSSSRYVPMGVPLLALLCLYLGVFLWISAVEKELERRSIRLFLNILIMGHKDDWGAGMDLWTLLTKSDQECMGMHIS